MRERVSKIYNSVCKWLSVRNITLMTIGIFILMLIPMFLCSFVNRASGDDYGYGVLTRAAWMTTHSLIAVIKAAFQTIIQYYYGWQGTWFSIFLFTLQPEVFSEKAYVIVVFLVLFLWIGSTFLVFGKLLRDKLHYDKWSTTLIIIIFLIFCISFIPRKKSAIFWYNGCAHYMLPFVMCQMVVYWLLQYGEAYKRRYLVGILIFMALLGGANYQATLFVGIAAVYFVIADFILKKDKRTLLLIIAIVLETVGLIISMKAPGNAVRAGEGFGFSLAQGVNTIIMSFVGGLKDIGYYVQTYPIVFVGFIAMFFVVLGAVKRRGAGRIIKYPMVSVIAMFCLYSAMQAPAIYAGVEVSGGVYNTNFQVFMIMMTLIVIVVAEKLGVCLKEYNNIIWNEIHERIVLPGLFICVMLMLVFRSDIKESTTWMCIEYITTGQAADYKKQMDQLTQLMTDDSMQDIVVPFINDMQGPLMHMPVTENPQAWTNTVICQYYGKNSVVAMPRMEWEEKYWKICRE